MAIKLEIKNLYKIFGEHPQRAFKYIEKDLPKNNYWKNGTFAWRKDASLTIEEGEIFVIMGLSGSGKSTMVRLLNRLIEPTRGQVLIDGVDIAKISEAELREVRRKKDRYGISVICADAAYDRARQCRLWYGAGGYVDPGAPAESAGGGCVRSARRITRMLTRMSSPAECASASASPARWPSTLISY